MLDRSPDADVGSFDVFVYVLERNQLLALAFELQAPQFSLQYRFDPPCFG